MASGPSRPSHLLGDSRTPTPPHGTPSTTERRRAPRIRVRCRLPASFTTASVPIAIRNISLGGILVESPEPFPVGVVHQLRMAAHDEHLDRPELTAQSVYSQSEFRPDGGTTFLTGFAFTAANVGEAKRFVFDLVNQATTPY